MVCIRRRHNGTQPNPISDFSVEASRKLSLKVCRDSEGNDRENTHKNFRHNGI